MPGETNYVLKRKRQIRDIRNRVRSNIHLIDVLEERQEKCINGSYENKGLGATLERGL